LSTINQEKRGNLKSLSRISSATHRLLSVIYEIPTDADESGITFTPNSLASSSSYNHQEQRRSTGTRTFERQLSILDPMSDRVSTILVWQNLFALTRKDKKKHFFQSLTLKKSSAKN